MRYNTLPDKMAVAGRLGMKVGKGWYKYEKGSRKGVPDPDTEALIAEHAKTSGVPQRTISDQEIEERCVYAMINEGFKVHNVYFHIDHFVSNISICEFLIAGNGR